jgi:phosphoribosylaminoimidazolecarboxamide formyltransferase/IMP cyclohydrolase
MNLKVKRALISVTDKNGVVEFARALADRGVEIIASGGTARVIKEGGTDVTEISDVTGFPECMDGRVKTLHPKIHGGILADRSKKEHLDQAAQLGVELIDLVVVNLYRFREAASDPELTAEEIVEQIDIGGPTLIRSAAKNHASVTVITDPADYAMILGEMESNEGIVPGETRRMLASKAFHHTASYDSAISSWFEGLEQEGGMPGEWIRSFRKSRSLRYGENPHQKAALYIEESPAGSFHEFIQHQGKELSFNNIQDMWASFLLACDLGENSCTIIKHMNPCGAAVCASVSESFLRARETDPISAFGSVVTVNGIVDGELAEASKEGFIEVILARGFTDEAFDSLRKKKNLRLITIPEGEWNRDFSGPTAREAGPMLLVQDRDTGFPELEKLEIVTSRKPSPEEEAAMRLSWKVVKHIKSNGIVICDTLGTVGVGAGQMSRVDSCKIAVEKARTAGTKIEGASAGSDAFFPFPDGVEALVDAGVRCIIQPGGSMRDEEVIAAAERLGITMAITGRRHFRH